jgi:hypothetical protein
VVPDACKLDSGFERLPSVNGLHGSHFGPEVGFEEIAVISSMPVSGQLPDCRILPMFLRRD